MNGPDICAVPNRTCSSTPTASSRVVTGKRRSSVGRALQAASSSPTELEAAQLKGLASGNFHSPLTMACSGR